MQEKSKGIKKLAAKYFQIVITKSNAGKRKVKDLYVFEKVATPVRTNHQIYLIKSLDWVYF